MVVVIIRSPLYILYHAVYFEYPGIFPELVHVQCPILLHVFFRVFWGRGSPRRELHPHQWQPMIPGELDQEQAIIRDLAQCVKSRRNKNISPKKHGKFLFFWGDEWNFGIMKQ